MNVVHIHFRAGDGEIFGHENSPSPDKQPGLEIASFEVSEGRHLIPDPALQKIDPQSRELVNKNEAERKLARFPPVLIAEISLAVMSTLSATDAYMLPDRPMSDEKREAWRAYRQVLRDISKLSTPAEMISEWPIDPIGLDAISILRARHAEANK